MVGVGVRRIIIHRQNKSCSLSSLATVCLRNRFHLSFFFFFQESCESKTAQLQSRLKSCTLSGLITQTPALPPRWNAGISYQNIQMCPITES